MAFTNEDRKEICAKILYLGPKGAGKTSNLRSLFALTSPELQAGTHSFSPDVDSSSFFEFLPFSMGKILDYEVKVHLFAFDLNSPLKALRKILFTGVDGFVFVVDSQMERLIANRESWKQARFVFKDEGYVVSELPHVMQFNKRDMKGAIASSVLSKEFNLYEAPEQEAVATKSEGSLETLNLITRQIIDRFVPAYSYASPRKRKKEAEASL